MSAVRLSASACELARIVAVSGAAHVANVLGVDESAVRAWTHGRRSPKPDMRAKLAAFDARLLADGWTVDAAEAPAAAAPARKPRPKASRLTPPRVPATGEERLLEVIRQCDELFAEASDPEAHASVRDRTAILAAKASATVRLSKVRGEDAVSMRKWLASKDWAAIQGAVYDVLAKGPPELATELAARLRTIIAEEESGWC